ncbi:hypothetical protein OHA44_37595 [Streptomyces sp. NBC_00144]|uniref:hypothetical protein n=1 Tax=Streptomyces sp. NBC_00144 TaxID=2975665 RepID=UPI003249B1DE
MAAYKGFWREQVKAYAKADIKGTSLKKYATLDALSRVEIDVERMKGAGTVSRGEPTHDAKVTALGLDKKIPDADLTDCLDISKWQTVKRASGEVVPFPKSQPARYITSVSAEKWGKQWLITKVTPNGDRSC